MKTKTKPMPSLRNDAEAERFVAKEDLTQYDLSGFEPMRFKIVPEDGSGSGCGTIPGKCRDEEKARGH